MDLLFFDIFITLIAIIEFVFIGYVLLVILRFRKQTQTLETTQTNSSFLLIYLGAVEMSICFVLIFTTSLWPSVEIWCHCQGFLLLLLHPIALWTVTGLNCDRYWKIVDPLHYDSFSSRCTVTGMAASWVGILLFCLLPFSDLIPSYSYNPEFRYCTPSFDDRTWITTLFGSVYAILGVGLPIILVMICNYRILRIVKYHHRNTIRAICEAPTLATSIQSRQNSFMAGRSLRLRKATKTVIQLIGSLCLLYLPYIGTIIWEVCYADRNHFHIHKFGFLASIFLRCSPFINIYFYGYQSRFLKSSIQNYRRKQAIKLELQEIRKKTQSVADSRRRTRNPFPSREIGEKALCSCSV